MADQIIDNKTGLVVTPEKPAVDSMTRDEILVEILIILRRIEPLADVVGMLKDSPFAQMMESFG